MVHFPGRGQEDLSLQLQDEGKLPAEVRTFLLYLDIREAAVAHLHGKSIANLV